MLQAQIVLIGVGGPQVRVHDEHDAGRVEGQETGAQETTLDAGGFDGNGFGVTGDALLNGSVKNGKGAFCATVVGSKFKPRPPKKGG